MLCSSRTSLTTWDSTVMIQCVVTTSLSRIKTMPTISTSTLTWDTGLPSAKMTNRTVVLTFSEFKMVLGSPAATHSSKVLCTGKPTLWIKSHSSIKTPKMKLQELWCACMANARSPNGPLNLDQFQMSLTQTLAKRWSSSSRLHKLLTIRLSTQTQTDWKCNRESWTIGQPGTSQLS